MREPILPLALGLLALSAAAHAQEAPAAPAGEITVWSWNIAAEALDAVADDFMAANPGTVVTVEDLGFQQVLSRVLAGCAAGGADLPDLVSLPNEGSEIYWAQFPDCFTDLRTLGYDEALRARFPDFKRTELEPGGVAYAMPWDSGPVAMFYRRDMYEAAGVDPDAIETWDDFIEAGREVQEANPGVTMTQASLGGETEWFRMIANEQGCGYFSGDAQSITVNGPGCVAALETIKRLVDAGLMGTASWDEKIQSNNANAVATQMFGAWYEGTIRSTAPEDQAGAWGVYMMPSVTAGGARAANYGGSALAIPASSEAPATAYAFMAYALGTTDVQVAMLRDFGLVPSLLTAIEDPYVAEPSAFWGGQAVWADILATLPAISPNRGTPFHGDADAIVLAAQTAYLNGDFDSAQSALDDAASQIELVTGLPIAE